jgi:hypothetical protein
MMMWEAERKLKAKVFFFFSLSFVFITLFDLILFWGGLALS